MKEKVIPWCSSRQRLILPVQWRGYPQLIFESRRAFFIPAYIVLLGAEKSIASREGRRLATYTLSIYLPTYLLFVPIWEPCRKLCLLKCLF